MKKGINAGYNAPKRVRKVFKPEEGKSFIQMFGEKGYVISMDENDRLLAMKVENGKTYYFDMNEQLSFLKKELTGKGIILQ